MAVHDRADPEIHGEDGLGGVVGLPTFTSSAISSRLKASEGLKAIEGIANATRKAIDAGTKIHLVACGPLTNIALFISIYPELIAGIEEICFMGGGTSCGRSTKDTIDIVRDFGMKALVSVIEVLSLVGTIDTKCS
jgi:uridine nucleosidase